MLNFANFHRLYHEFRDSESIIITLIERKKVPTSEKVGFTLRL